LASNFPFESGFRKPCEAIVSDPSGKVEWPNVDACDLHDPQFGIEQGNGRVRSQPTTFRLPRPSSSVWLKNTGKAPDNAAHVFNLPTTPHTDGEVGGNGRNGSL
jgi:hypothetical protein